MFNIEFVIFIIVWLFIGFIAWGFHRASEYSSNQIKGDFLDNFLMFLVCCGLGFLTMMLVIIFEHHKYGWRFW